MCFLKKPQDSTVIVIFFAAFYESRGHGKRITNFQALIYPAGANLFLKKYSKPGLLV